MDTPAVTLAPVARGAPGNQRMYEVDGGTSPVRGLTGLWILLPIAGIFVWFFKVQGALNRYWEGKSA